MLINGAINIINGFNLGAPYPIDYRMVMPNASERDAIVHKYDGLKVFLTDTREVWTWNEGTTQWDSESSISGGGSASYVPKWNNSQSLDNSSLYNTSNRVGLNTTSPSGSFHIRQYGGVTASSLVFDTPSSSIGFIGYGSYYNGPNLTAFDSTKGSISLRFDNSSSLIFYHRKPGDGVTAHTTKFIIGYLNSLNQYCNYLNGAGNRNYIVGSSSVTPLVGTNLSGAYTDTAQDLLMVNGSFRSNSKYSKQTTTLDYSYSGGSYLMSLSYYNNQTSSYNNIQNFNTPNSILNPTNGTFQMVDEHELVVYNQTSGFQLKPLSFNLPLTPELGREIVIDYIKSPVGSTYSTISSSSIKNLDGALVTSFIINPGERVKIVYVGGSSPLWQVVELVSDNQSIKNDITYLKSSIETQLVNGTYGSGASQSSYQLKRTILNGNEITVEAIITGSTRGVDNTGYLVANLPIIPQGLAGKKYFKIRHMVSSLTNDSKAFFNTKNFYLTFNHLVNNGNPMVINLPLNAMGEYIWIDDTISDLVAGVSNGAGDFIDGGYISVESVNYTSGMTHILPVIGSYPINLGLQMVFTNPVVSPIQTVTIKVIISGYLL